MCVLNDARKRDGLESARPKCPTIIYQGIFRTLRTPISNSLSAREENQYSCAKVIESGTPVLSVLKAEAPSVEDEERIAIQSEGSLDDL